MHYHCEIVMPKTDDIHAAITKIMSPFYEGDEENLNAFWGWWVIGGRWAGNKLVQGLDQGKLDEFKQWLTDAKITVSGLQAGKKELFPRSQIPIVDAKWNEMFPRLDGEVVPCPLFNHSNDQYNRYGLSLCQGDIADLKDCKHIKCSRVIFAAKAHDDELEASFMLVDDEWNGVNHMPVRWDGTIEDALNQFAERCEGYTEEYRQRAFPQDDWMVVTVDYHN